MKFRILILILVAVAWPLGAFAQVEEDASNGYDRYLRTQVRVNASMGFSTNELTGGSGATTINLKDSDYNAYGMEARWFGSRSPIGMRFNYEQSSTNLTSPTGIVPVSPTVREQDIKLIAILKPAEDASSWLAKLRWGLGYEWITRDANMTSPVVLISNEKKSGPVLMIERIGKLNGSFQYSLGTDIGMINAYKEAAPTAGSYEWGFRVGLNAMLLCPLGKSWDLSFGAKLLADRTSYYGVGGRGLSDATKTEMRYSFPLEFIFLF